MLSNAEALYISSAYNLPYPVAAAEEFKTIIARVCSNDKRRLGIMRRSLGRLPASDRKSQKEIAYKIMRNSYKIRCIDLGSRF